MSFIKSTIFLLLVLVVSSCSVSKHLKEDARVHVKTKITIDNPEIVENIKKVETQVYSLTQPKPATGIGKWQTNLYNKYSIKVKRDSTGKAKGIRGWVLRKIGLAPVWFDYRKTLQSRALIQKYFNDNGYFGTNVKVDTTVKKKKEVIINYNVFPKRRYSVNNVFFPKDSSELSKTIFSDISESLLLSNEPYLQSNLTEERERLADLANDSGFLNVNKDHFYFFVDTALGSHHLDIYVKIKQPKDSTVFETFRLDQNTVFAAYSLSNGQGDTKHDSVTTINNFEIIQKKKIIKPKVLAKIIGGEKGELFSATKQDNALTRLLDLGIYKFVNLKIEPKFSNSSYFFDRNFYLTPALMQDVSAEFEAISRSTSYFGIGSTVTYAHKNIFKGAERLDIRVSGGIGTQTNQTEQLLNTLDGDVELSITFPRLISPFKFNSYKGAFIPKTRISIGDNYQRRVEYYTVNTFNFKFGYDWAETKRIQHQFFPFNINLFVVQDITEAMEEIFLTNPRLEKSFTDVFILGFFYNYTLSTQTTDPTEPYFYMRTGFETSGNVANLLISTIGKQQQKPFDIFGAPYAQFIRIDGDFRFYCPQKKGNLVFRGIGGIGIAYDNSPVLPYIKQYFIGGPSSIRAFQFRALGPGSVVPPEKKDNNFIEQTGDMRLEVNAEYRFPIFGYFKGALFVDAGNIWLLDDPDKDTPEGVFEFNRFYKEIAVGSGLGFRLDLNFW